MTRSHPTGVGRGAGPVSTGTASALNRMDPLELRRFLDDRREARLGTVRTDGDVHLTPVWYVRDGDAIQFCLEERRVHLKNLRRRPRATLLIDEDERLTTGWQAAARAVMLSGPVTLIAAQYEVEKVRQRLQERYYGNAIGAPAFIATRGPALTYVLGSLTAERVLSWDLSKG